VIRHNTLQEIEPEKGDLGQHASLVRNAGCQHVIEGRDAVGCDKKQVVIIQAVNVTHLTAGMKFEFWEICCQKDGVE
jgi:hypothetical protein